MGMESQQRWPQVLHIAVRGVVTEGAAAGNVGIVLWHVGDSGRGCVGGWEFCRLVGGNEALNSPRRWYMDGS